MTLTENRLRKIVQEELADVLFEDDPCWEGYTMVGMKQKDGEMVPNCVPDDDVENYEG